MRSVLAAIVSFVLVAGVMVAGSAPVAHAAPGDLAFGRVVVDSNKNNAIDSSPNTGSNDTPLAGVKVTLKGSTADHAGWTVTTKADGTWSFSADEDYSASPGPFTVTIDAKGVNGNAYLVPLAPTAGVNDFTRVSGTSQQSVSASFAAAGAPQELNALVYPTWSTSVIPAKDSNGVGGNAIWTGTTPFDASDSQPGFDAGMSNTRIRTADVINHTWSIAVNAETDLDSNANIWFEQELKLSGGALVNFGAMPKSCNPTTSKIVTKPLGTELDPREDPEPGTESVVLKCDLGPMGEAKAALLLDTQVFVSANSTNGATFTEEVRTYGATKDGVTTARPDGPHSFGPFQITAAPRYDIEKTGGFIYGGWSPGKLPNGETVTGKYIYYNVQIATDRRVGVEAFQQPITFEESLWGQYAGTGQNGPDGSVNAGMNWYMADCYPHTGDGRQKQGTAVYGKVGMKSATQTGQFSTTTNSVRDSGSCGFARSDESATTSNYTITLSGIDASGASYPTQSVNGTTLPADKYYVASYEFVMFVPREEIDKMTGTVGDGVGLARIWNRVGDFDPSGKSGASNYGDLNEPGYCAPGPNTDRNTNCDLMPDKKPSNNVTGPVELKISPGVWSKEFTDQRGPWNFRNQHLPGGSGSHAGNGQVQPGQTFTSKVSASPETDNPGLQFCDVFDNSVLRLSPLGDDTTDPVQSYGGAYSQMAYSAPSKEIDVKAMPAYQSNFEVLYGHVDLTGDNPNTGVFNTADNRWEGDWSKQQAAASAAGTACGNPNITFVKNPADLPGGIDAVNVVWAKAVNGYVQPANSAVLLLTGMEQRNTYNGGPHDGQEIPANTISANYGNVKGDSLGAWVTNNYYPGAGNTGGSYHPGESPLTTGDRWSLVRAEMAIKKWSVAGKVNGVDATGVADDGQTGSADAGTPVIWHVHPTLSAVSDPAAPVNNVTITDKLPAQVVYDADATAALGGIVPTQVTVNADGTTTLVWLLGTRIPNQPLPDLQVATHVDPFVLNNTTLTNSVNIKADGIVPVAGAHNDTHSVTVTQPGSLQLKKQVDQVLDLQDKDQVFTLQVKNFSENLEIAAPTIIDVLPYVGDGTNAALVNRNPASDFSGSNRLSAAPQAFDFEGTTPAAGTFHYTTIDPAAVPQHLNDDTDPSIWTTTFTPDATAFKFVAKDPLGNVGAGAKSGLIIRFQTEQTGNEAGDLYANRFTAFSDTLKDVSGDYQLLTSNQVMVRVVGFSLGDLIWFDINNDGKFDPTIDKVAPEGVKVEVHRADGSLAPGGNVTTNKDGRWVLNDLPEGDYYAVIPASEFAPGAKLAGWKPQTIGYVADPNNNANENADNNGAAQPDGSIRTGTINLSAKVNGSVITGNEPLGDNTGNVLVTPGTTDDFTNFTLDIALKATPGYEFTKTADPASGTAVAAGDTITYTLTGRNTGMTPLDVAITDDLTKVLEFAPITTAPQAAIAGASNVPAPVVDGTRLTWNGTVQPGQTVVVTYSVTVGEGHEGKIVNNKATSTATPPYEPPITPPSVVTEHPIPGYTLAKTADPASGETVRPGDTITYTVTGTNTGATVLDPVVVTDDLTDVLNNATRVGDPVVKIEGQATPPAASVGADNILRWTGKLEIGQAVVITYQVKVNADATEKAVLIHNKVTSSATPPVGPPITPPEVTTEHPVPGYTFTKTSDPVSGSTVQPGEEITYTLTGVNTGALDLDPVVIRDDLAQVLNNATISSAPVATIAGEASVPAVSLEGTNLSWTGSLKKGQTVVVTYTVTVNEDAGSKAVLLKNSATSEATPPGEPPITPPGVTTEHPVPGYTFAKTSNPASGTTVQPGEEITYTLTGVNTGATDLDPVVIRDDLAQVLNNATISSAPVATIQGESSVPVVTLNGTDLSWTGSLKKGQTVVVTYKVTVNEDAGSKAVLLKNSATSEATPPGEPPITPPGVTTEHPVPGYTFAKTSNPASGTTVGANGEITYTLTGVNTGATVLDPVTISDDLSNVLNNATITKEPVATIEGATGVPAPVRTGNDVTWTGVLAKGQTVTITYTVKLNGDVAEKAVVVNNHATSTATPPGEPPITPPPGETEHPVPGYTFTKTSNPVSGTAVAPKGYIVYTLTGTNTGATVLDPVVISDDLSKVLNHAKITEAPVATISGGAAGTAPAVVVNGDQLTWTGVLQKGQKVEITYTVQLDEGTDTGAVLVNNHASSTATPPPGVPPITPPDVTTEHPVPGYTFTKVSDPASGTPVSPKGEITYTLTGTNTGATVLDPVVIQDDLSKVLNHATVVKEPVARIQGVANVPAAERDGNAISWTGKLEKGQSVTITYTVKLNADAEGVIVNNHASSSATPPGLPPITPPDVETWHPTPGYTFNKVADPASGSTVQEGDTITYTLTGTNFGKTDLDPVVVTDDLSKVLDKATLDKAPVATIVKDGTSSPAPVQPTLDGTALTWTHKLGAGEQVVIVYSVTVKAGGEGTIINNRANSEATPPGQPPITPPEVVTEHPIPGYTLSKSSDPVSGSTVKPNSTITYTVTGTNTGATALDPVVITDDMSRVLAHATLVGEPKATIISATGASNAAAPTVDGTTLTWTGKLAVGERVELVYTVKVNADAASVTLKNVVTSTATPPGGGELVPPPGTTTHEVPPPPVKPTPTPTPTTPTQKPTPSPSGEPTPKPTPSNPGGNLPQTGTDVPLWLPIGAGLLVLLGAGTLIAARTRREH